MSIIRYTQKNLSTTYDLQSGECVKPYITTNLPIGGPIISSRKALPYVLKFQKET